MKITRVETVPVDRYLFVQVHTDAGLTGLGESGVWGYLEASEKVVEKLSMVTLALFSAESWIGSSVVDEYAGAVSSELVFPNGATPNSTLSAVASIWARNAPPTSGPHTPATLCGRSARARRVTNG